MPRPSDRVPPRPGAKVPRPLAAKAAVPPPPTSSTDTTTAVKAPSSALSGADDAETAVDVPEDIRTSLAEMTMRADAKNGRRPTLAPPPPASSRPSPPPSRPSAPPPLPARAVATPAPQPPRSSRPSIVPAPITVIGAPPSSRPSPPSSRPLPPPPVHAFGHIPNATPDAPPVPMPAAFVPPPASTLRGFGPSPGVPLPPSSSSPMIAPAVGTVPPAPPSSSPMSPRLSTPKAFAPFEGQVPPAHVAYERAFRAWSSPNAAEVDDTTPLTYQVYTPKDLAAPRPISLSRLAEEPVYQPKPSLASRLAVVALGVLTVLGTAGVIVFATGDDAPERTSATSTLETAVDAPPVATNALVAPSLATSTTTTTALDVAAPAATPAAVVVVEPAKAPAPAPAPRAATATKKASPTTSSAPASIRQAAPPPNPYGGTPPSVLRPPPGYKR